MRGRELSSRMSMIEGIEGRGGKGRLILAHYRALGFRDRSHITSSLGEREGHPRMTEDNEG